MAVGAHDIFQDVASSGRPDEWLGIDVVITDMFLDGCSQFWDAGAHASSEMVLRNVAEKSLYHIQP